MTIASALKARLLSLSAVTALVGTRVRVLKLWQGDLDSGPAIRLQQIGAVEEFHMRGSSNLFRSRVQVDSYAAEQSSSDPYATATAVDAAVHGSGNGTALGYFRGTAGTLAIKSVLPIDVSELFDAEERRQVRIMRQYSVMWSQ